MIFSLENIMILSLYISLIYIIDIFMPTLLAFDAPLWGRGSRRNIATRIGVEKLEWFGYPMV